MSMDFVEAVRRRWLLVGGIALGMLILVATWTLLSPKVYLGRSSIVFDGFQADPTDDAGAQGQTLGGAFLGTQADVINSDLVASQVIALTNLDHNPAIVGQWRQSTDDRVGLDEWLSARLLGGLTVVPGKATNVLSLEYRAADADYASQIANAFAEAYVRTQLLLKVQPAKVFADWFGQRTADVRQRLETAQSRLTSYQRDHGLIGGAKIDVEMSHLAELSTALAGAEGQATEASARASGDTAMLPDVQGSAVVAGLRGAIASKGAALREMQSSYGPNHPDVLSARAELAALQAKLGEATGQATSSVRVASAAAQGHEAALRQRVAEQRARVLALSSFQDQLSVLQRDVDSAQQAYDAVTKRLNSVRLQSELPRTSASVLDHASPSYLPVSPNVPLRLLLGAALGVMLGISAALALEFFQPRVRTEAGLHAATGLPRLAVVSSPPRWTTLPLRFAPPSLKRLWS